MNKRPQTNIPAEPIAPYPILHETQVISGFGRGSSELGIPTANIPMNEKLNQLETGIYFGWCQVSPKRSEVKEEVVRGDGTKIQFNNGELLESKEKEVLPMVMSIGWNPFYQNKEKAAEVHIIYKFSKNFYGAHIKCAILGYIRPELDYTTKEALIEDINIDIQIALDTLNKDAYKNKYIV